MNGGERRVRLAIPADQARVEELLYAAFGDENGFLRAFFTRVWQRHAVTLSLEDDRAAAMAALFSCGIADGKGHTAPALYLYALTTDQAYRRRGHARALLRDAAARCPTVFLHAADAGLQAIYALLGWQNALYARRERFESSPSAPAPALRAVSAADYCAAREALLQNEAHIVWPVELLNFHRDMLPSLAGGLFAGEGAACAASGIEDGTLRLSEALGGGAAQGAMRACGCARAFVLLPCAQSAPGAFPLAQAMGALPPMCRMTFDFN